MPLPPPDEISIKERANRVKEELPRFRISPITQEIIQQIEGFRSENRHQCRRIRQIRIIESGPLCSGGMYTRAMKQLLLVLAFAAEQRIEKDFITVVNKEYSGRDLEFIERINLRILEEEPDEVPPTSLNICFDRTIDSMEDFLPTFKPYTIWIGFHNLGLIRRYIIDHAPLFPNCFRALQNIHHFTINSIDATEGNIDPEFELFDGMVVCMTRLPPYVYTLVDDIIIR